MHREESAQDKVSGDLNDLPLGLRRDWCGDGGGGEDGGDGDEEGSHGDQSVRGEASHCGPGEKRRGEEPLTVLRYFLFRGDGTPVTAS